MNALKKQSFRQFVIPLHWCASFDYLLITRLTITTAPQFTAGQPDHKAYRSLDFVIVKFFQTPFTYSMSRNIFSTAGRGSLCIAATFFNLYCAQITMHCTNRIIKKTPFLLWRDLFNNIFDDQHCFYRAHIISL